MGGQNKQEHHGENPIVQLMVSMSGAGGSEHESEPPGASPVSFKAGHEPDQFQVKGILYVPIFVVIVLIVTYVVVSGTFFKLLEVEKPLVRPGAYEKTVQENEEFVDKRFGRISSSDPNAPVKEPRLEYLRPPEEKETPDDRAFVRSKLPKGTGLEIRPEDLRPGNYVDPTLHRKVLDEYQWVVPNKVARIKIEDAIVLTAKTLPIRKDPVRLNKTEDRAKASNGGHGGANSTNQTPPAPPAPVIPAPMNPVVPPAVPPPAVPPPAVPPKAPGH